MNLEKHIIDTIKEWQLKIGYREGNMKLYYPGESLEELLGITKCDIYSEGQSAAETCEPSAEHTLQTVLNRFCDELEPKLGRIKISGSYERYCLDIPAKGCAYVAGKVPEPKFLKRFLQIITNPGSTMVQIRECFESYGMQEGTAYVEELVMEDAEVVEENHDAEAYKTEAHRHHHGGYAFYFEDSAVEEYVYWVEENEFGLTYHRFTRGEFQKLK